MKQPPLDYSATHFATASGRMVDLIDPRPEDIDFADVAEHLAKVKRYLGATAGVEYSVAEHCVRGAEAILDGGPFAGDVPFPPAPPAARRRLAALFLMHDAPEYALCDDITPKKRALAAIAQRFGVLASAVEAAFAELTENFDRAVHTAAGLGWPLAADEAVAVKVWDRIMLDTEWRDLMRLPHPWPPGPMLAGRIVPWPWTMARRLFERRAHELLPALWSADARYDGSNEAAP